MKYNVGEKVKVRSDLKEDVLYGPLYASGDMLGMAGKEVTIKAINPRGLLGVVRGTYHIEEDPNKTPDIPQLNYLWTAEMFEDVTPATPVKKTVPMPKLENGMFGIEDDGEAFVVVNEVVVYEGGLCDHVSLVESNNKVTALYEAHCFKEVHDDKATVIWKRDTEVKEETPDERIKRLEAKIAELESVICEYEEELEEDEEWDDE